MDDYYARMYVRIGLYLDFESLIRCCQQLLDGPFQLPIIDSQDTLVKMSQLTEWCTYILNSFTK